MSELAYFVSQLPPLDGRCELAVTERQALARDAGGLVSKLPGAVLRPGSVDDVVKVVRACGHAGVRAVARGQGHTTLGQAQVEGGVLIDMRSLHQVHELAADSVSVDAGATWRSLLNATMPARLTPPVLTGFQGLSIGGTLSVGGISGTAYRRGPQLEHVLELDVVTGRGELVTCSAQRHCGLFEAALGGLGRCAIIVRARLSLCPRPTRLRRVSVTFNRKRPFLAALRELAQREQLDSLSGNIYPSGQGEARYELNALLFDASEVDIARLVPQFSQELSRSSEELAYLDHCLQVDHLLEALAATGGGWEGFAHPWFDAFLPSSRCEEFLDAVLPTLDTTVDVGPAHLGALAQIHIFPLLTRYMKKPLLRVPDEPLVYLFDLLTSGHQVGSTPQYRARMLERNRELFACARRLGATRYGIAAVPMTSVTWSEELADAFPAFAEQKRLHDPSSILGSLAESSPSTSSWSGGGGSPCSSPPFEAIEPSP